MELLAIFGMVVALVVMCILIFKGYHALIAAIVASIIIALSGQIPLATALNTNYMTGFVGFIQSNFLVFLAGALLGKIYEITGGASALAKGIVKVAGPKFALLSIPAAVGLMAYCGIHGYVLCFAIYPIAVEVYRSADIPRRFIPAAIMLGACTFAGFGPGNPQLTNVAMANALGTPLTAAFGISVILTIFQLVLSFALLYWVCARAKAKGEHFIPRDSDPVNAEDRKLPSPLVAFIPLLITLIGINLKNSEGAPLTPTSFGVFLGAVLAYLVLRGYRVDKDSLVTTHFVGALNGTVGATIATSAMVAVGTVARSSAGWDTLISTLTSIPGPALLSASVGGFLLGGICASGTGAAALGGPIFGPIYAAQGVPLESLHRTLIISNLAGGTLPNNGMINTVTNGICDDTYKECYGPVFITIPFTMICTTILSIILFTIFA